MLSRFAFPRNRHSPVQNGEIFPPQVEIRVFSLYYNRLMQEQRFTDSYSRNLQGYQHILDGFPLKEDFKHEIPMSSPEEQSFGESFEPRKKGRPRGLKNSKMQEKKQKKEKMEGKHHGHWVLSENKRYHWFLEVNHHYFVKKQLRRLEKIFKIMSTYIGTREAEQCRSHHQKMEKKYHSFSRILQHLRQQHYGTTSTEELEIDIKREFEENHKILTQDEIKGNFIERIQPKAEPASPIKSETTQNSNLMLFDNILDDNYEHQFGFEFWCSHE